MSKRWTRSLLIIAGVGGLAIAACTNTVYSDEDRPPIVVKNGSIIFENDRDWVPGATRAWTLDQPKGKAVTTFDVSFKSVSCASTSGTVVTIIRTSAGGQTQTYKVIRTGGSRPEPLINAPVDMDVDNVPARKTLTSRDSGGAITEVKVAGGTTCTVPPGGMPEIEIKPR